MLANRSSLYLWLRTNSTCAVSRSRTPFHQLGKLCKTRPRTHTHWGCAVMTSVAFAGDSRYAASDRKSLVRSHAVCCTWRCLISPEQSSTDRHSGTPCDHQDHDRNPDRRKPAFRLLHAACILAIFAVLTAKRNPARRTTTVPGCAQQSVWTSFWLSCRLPLRSRDRSCQTTSTGPAMGNGCSFFPDTMRHIRGVNWVQKEAASPSLDLF